MAKPRIFLSSTCFDLSDARAELTSFLNGCGFEVLNSQSGKFGVKPKVHSHDACLAMMEQADYVVLIIGGRRGGTYVGSEKSITNEEIRAAQKLDRPVFAFLDKRVDALRAAYRKNPGADFTPTIDDVRIVDFVDTIAAGHEDNWLHLFDNVTDIKSALTAQFAYILLLYSQGLRKKAAKAPAESLKAVPFPSSLDGVPGADEAERTIARAGLRHVYECLKAVLAADVKESIKAEQMKAIWVVARHGEADDRHLKVREERFKASAWGRHRGKRVFAQMTNCGISGEYDFEEDSMGNPYGTVELVFKPKKQETYPAEALKDWVSALIKQYGEDDALDFFKRLDMRVFSEGPNAKMPLKPKPNAA
ncbi:DUF4062 domain-containing protein [Aquabacter sediminis]|uniref:DUF4062 domain-containing protein n=1 Tax=Aquabacter sediminis TaxID=3029197 RepID=UPI00237DE461|nr:DUF4062 domain-containing protein [Aquabacter sp. P-9]MDE1570330.1 DUF4062 domain-containing protein [Aquabacter sp. P-9]